MSDQIDGGTSGQPVPGQSAQALNPDGVGPLAAQEGSPSQGPGTGTGAPANWQQQIDDSRRRQSASDKARVKSDGDVSRLRSERDIERKARAEIETLNLADLEDIDQKGTAKILHENALLKAKNAHLEGQVKSQEDLVIQSSWESAVIAAAAAQGIDADKLRDRLESDGITKEAGIQNAAKAMNPTHVPTPLAPTPEPLPSAANIFSDSGISSGAAGHVRTLQDDLAAAKNRK